MNKTGSRLRRAQSSVLRRGEVTFKDDHIDMDGSLKAAVFGFNDGLCANTCLMIGIASASSIEPSVVIASGLVGLFAGAASMAAGEWISMTLQNQAEKGEIEKERQHILQHEQIEDAHFAEKLKEIGFSQKTIQSISDDMVTGDRQRDVEMKLKLHAKLELGLDIDEARGDPIKSMGFMMASFSFGAIIPLIPWIPLIYPGPIFAFYCSILFSVLASAAVGVVMASFTTENRIETAARQVYAVTLAIISVWGVGYIYSLMGGDPSVAA